jgi:hypothetical protein
VRVQGPARRIVQFRARRSIEGAIKSPCNKDLAVGQQSGRVKIACCVEAASESPGPARRIVAGRQCRDWPRSQKQRARALLGCGSLPEREWDHANGYKQNQVKGTSKKMGSNHGINILFQFDRAPAKQTPFYW